jgi:predicted DNA-binding transcriptional regulator YafY
MNRTDRLYAIAEELRYAGEAGRTSASLATQYEVSTRTIKRDISSLQQAGVPIWSEGRAGGGYRLLPAESSLPAINFTSGEAVALAVAIHANQDMPFANDGASALTKILSVMTPATRETADDVLSRVWIRGHRNRGLAARRLDEAIRLHRVTNINYDDANGNPSKRTVEPLLLARTGGHWYLMAYCRLRDNGRWFRLDRIRTVTTTTETAAHRDFEALFGEAPPDAHSLQWADQTP